ncbi:MAG: hypothetical protein WC455_13870 [Dehalococcoidia bacterium]|jgi:hypothetical protein
MSYPVTNDPEKYRRLSEAHTADETNATIGAFFADLGALREKHGFPDAIAIIGTNVQYEKGIGRAMTWVQYGDSNNAESMLAYGLGQAQKERRELVNRLMAGNKI